MENKTYEAGFKKKGPGEIWWLTCEAPDLKTATEKLREMTKGTIGYNLYAGPFIKK